MTAKRPRGITLFSSFIIFFSLLNLLSLRNMPHVRFPVLSFLYFLISIASIIAAIYLLKLVEWARLAIIAISIVIGLETLATSPFAWNAVQKYFSEDFERDYSKSLEAHRERIQTGGLESGIAADEATMKKTKQSARLFAYVLMTIIISVTVGFNAGVVYYFTRPSVKEHFT